MNLYLPLDSITSRLLQSYEREAREPRFDPEPWRAEAEVRLERAGVDLYWLRQVATHIDGAHEQGRLFLDLCSTRQPCFREPDWESMRAWELYRGLLRAFQDGEGGNPVTRQAHDFSLRCDNHLERVGDRRPGWRLLDQMVHEARNQGLRDLAETDRGGSGFQVVMDQPEAFLNAVLRRLKAEMERPIGQGNLPPLGPQDIDPADCKPCQAVEPPAPWLWPLEAQMEALYVCFASETDIADLKQPCNLARLEAAVVEAGVDLDLLSRLASVFGMTACCGAGLLKICWQPLGRSEVLVHEQRACSAMAGSAAEHPVDAIAQ